MNSSINNTMNPMVTNGTKINFTLNTSMEKPEMFPEEWERVRLVFLIGTTVLLIIGTVGNILTITVMRRGSLKKISTCFYMSVLALGDLGE